MKYHAGEYMALASTGPTDEEPTMICSIEPVSGFQYDIIPFFCRLI